MNQIDSETVSFAPDDAVLVLEDGQVYVGDSYGAIGKTTGEIVFATGMTGYQETLTDPSYDRQIVVQTFPHIGDTGINREDPESSRIWVAGYVVRDPSPTVSNWRATGSLDDDLVAEHIVGISHIDTRKLVRHLRSAGVMRAGIFSGDALLDDEGRLKTVAALIDEVKATPQMKGLSLYDEVSTKETYTVEPCGEYEGKEPLYTVAAVDLGVKGMTPHRMAERGCRVHVVPSTITFEELTALNPDGVFFSNGPGDPDTVPTVPETVRAILGKLPVFGICLGNQMITLAAGARVEKLPYGHHGGNEPVMNLLTGKVEITAQNHNYGPVFSTFGPLVPEPSGGLTEHPESLLTWSRMHVAPVAMNERYGRIRLTHVNLNDGTPEGIQFLDLPAFSMQYHPEAKPGPNDSAYMFESFSRLMDGREDYLAIDVREGRRF